MTMFYPEFKSEQRRPGTPANQTHKSGWYRRVFKRALDFTSIMLAAPVVVPVIGLLAVAVMTDGGNPFYCQSRIGQGGRTFRMWKLRSMVSDADERMEGHLAADPVARVEWEQTQKLRNDPRVTRFGRFLRRSSLDELPQLWNVLIGDMSLVGPRPIMLCQQSIYQGSAYYALRPGITGSWQTAGRHRTSFAARAEFDAVYEAELSFGTDARIMAKTLAVVMKGTGC